MLPDKQNRNRDTSAAGSGNWTTVLKSVLAPIGFKGGKHAGENMDIKQANIFVTTL